jgi:hypothetical protein
MICLISSEEILIMNTKELKSNVETNIKHPNVSLIRKVEYFLKMD